MRKIHLPMKLLYTREERQEIGKLNQKLAFEKYRSKINIKQTFHSQIRALERLGCTANECVEDIIKNITQQFQGTENPDICIVKGDRANYILTKDGTCITILTKSHKYMGFSDKKFNQGRFFDVKGVKPVVFKRK